jgi:hypothetical protein
MIIAIVAGLVVAVLVVLGRFMASLYRGITNAQAVIDTPVTTNEIEEP